MNGGEGRGCEGKECCGVQKILKIDPASPWGCKMLSGVFSCAASNNVVY